MPKKITAKQHGNTEFHLERARKRRAEIASEDEGLEAWIKEMEQFLATTPATREEYDMTGESCETCAKGNYQENPFGGRPDDWSGVLHCNACNAEVQRYRQRKSHEYT